MDLDQSTCYQQKLSNIKQASKILDQFQIKMNTYFNNNDHTNTKNEQKYRQKQNYLPHLVQSYNRHQNHKQNSLDQIQICRRNSINGYITRKDIHHQKQQLQFKYQHNNINKQIPKQQLKILPNPLIPKIQPSINIPNTQRQHSHIKISQNIIQQQNNQKQLFNILQQNHYSKNTKRKNKSDQFKLFNKNKSVEKDKIGKYYLNKQPDPAKQQQNNHLSNNDKQKTNKSNLLSEICHHNPINTNINQNTQQSNTKHLQNYGCKIYKQPIPHQLTKHQNKTNSHHLNNHLPQKNQQNNQNLSNIIPTSFSKNKNKLVGQMQTIQIVMKQRLSAKQRKIKQIYQQVLTQNQQRIYLYKINQKLNQQLKSLQQKQIAQGQQYLKNQQWQIKILQNQLSKLKIQIKNKKYQKKQLKKQQQALKQGYQTVLNNKKNILKNDIDNYIISQNKAQYNASILKQLIKQLDKLKGVVQSKIKNCDKNFGYRKTVKPVKN